MRQLRWLGDRIALSLVNSSIIRGKTLDTGLYDAEMDARSQWSTTLDAEQTEPKPHILASML